MRHEVLFNNLAEICYPQEEISLERVQDKWNSYNYETGAFSGTMLIAPNDSKPSKVKFDPKLLGWYRIYVGLYNAAYYQSEIQLKLTGDKSYYNMAPCCKRGFGEHIVEEVFWKCCLMDEQSIEIIKNNSPANKKLSAIAWIRCVSMTDNEVNEYQRETSRTDTKRLYATNDMHNVTIFHEANTEQAWLNVVQEYIDSDVEWLAIENIFNHNICEKENFSYVREVDLIGERAYQKGFPEDVLKKVVAYGQENGIKMCVSQRVASWCSDFPYDGIYFDSDFWKNHPNLRCIDRDGDVTDYMSYMYPEVQEYIIENLVAGIDSGCDALQPIFSRGWPFILFEEPFVELFKQRYNDNPRELPLDDERIMSLKCEIMTDLLHKLRKRMDELQGNKKVELHVKVINSLYDCKLVGLDIEEWARQGLVDAVISDDRRVWETLPDCVRQDDNYEKIDIAKYKEYADNSFEGTITYFYENDFPQMPDSKGNLKGSANLEERINEFVEIEKKYGMKCYIELMPRFMQPEKIKEKVIQMYNAGCEHIGLWDTYSRAVNQAQWNMWRLMGHKDEIEKINPYDEDYIKLYRLNKLGDKNVRSYKGVWGL